MVSSQFSSDPGFSSFSRFFLLFFPLPILTVFSVFLFLFPPPQKQSLGFGSFTITLEGLRWGQEGGEASGYLFPLPALQEVKPKAVPDEAPFVAVTLTGDTFLQFAFDTGENALSFTLFCTITAGCLTRIFCISE